MVVEMVRPLCAQQPLVRARGATPAGNNGGIDPDGEIVGAPLSADDGEPAGPSRHREALIKGSQLPVGVLRSKQDATVGQPQPSLHP